METREIWVRLGVTVKGSKQEIERVIKGDPVALYSLIIRDLFDVNGNSYVPESCIEEYNETYKTNHEVKDVEFDL